MKFVVFEVHLLIFILVCLKDVRQDNIPVSKDYDFGPFIIHHNMLRACKGPKVANATDFKVKLERKLNDDFIYFNFSVPKTVNIETMKIVYYQIKDGKKTKQIKFHITKPCSDWLHSLFFKQIVSDPNKCSLKPGNTSVALAMNKMLHAICGINNMPYGKFSGKVVMYSKTGNIACVESTVEIVPAVF